MKALSYILLITFGILLIYGVNELPERGNPDTPMNFEKSVAGTQAASDYYIKNALKDTETPNIVTAILADYRSYDTLGETTVIFCAGIVVFLILRKQKSGSKNR